MIHLLDLDDEYEMMERDEVKELAGKNELIIGRHRENIIALPDSVRYAYIGLTGECCHITNVKIDREEDACKVIPLIIKNDDFNGWDSWKEFNHKGYDCTVSFEILDNSIIIRTENHGISLKNTAIIEKDDSQVIYAALTGDQVAITNIRIIK